jgi:hypothetical protein
MVEGCQGVRSRGRWDRMTEVGCPTFQVAPCFYQRDMMPFFSIERHLSFAFAFALSLSVICL